jgi:hypothetical protein
LPVLGRQIFSNQWLRFVNSEIQTVPRDFTSLVFTTIVVVCKREHNSPRPRQAGFLLNAVQRRRKSTVFDSSKTLAECQGVISTEQLPFRLLAFSDTVEIFVMHQTAGLDGWQTVSLARFVM